MSMHGRLITVVLGLAIVFVGGCGLARGLGLLGTSCPKPGRLAKKTQREIEISEPELWGVSIGGIKVKWGSEEVNAARDILMDDEIRAYVVCTMVEKHDLTLQQLMHLNTFHSFLTAEPAPRPADIAAWHREHPFPTSQEEPGSAAICRGEGGLVPFPRITGANVPVRDRTDRPSELRLGFDRPKLVKSVTWSWEKGSVREARVDENGRIHPFPHFRRFPDAGCHDIYCREWNFDPLTENWRDSPRFLWLQIQDRCGRSNFEGGEPGILLYAAPEDG